MSNPVTERAYWRDPVQVLTGLTWLMLGGAIGFLIGLYAA